MSRIILSVYLLVSLSSVSLRAMVDPREDQEQPKQTPGPRGQIIFYSSMEEMKAIYANLFRPEGATPEATDAASTCNLEKLKQHVDSNNVNVADREKHASLLSLALAKQAQEKKFDPAAPDYLISLRAFTDRRSTTAELASPLMQAASLAIFQRRFAPVEYLLGKKANPFLPNQIHTGWSAAEATFQCRENQDPSGEIYANIARLMAMFAPHARTIHDALETYDILTIKKFADPQSINTPDAQGCTPLLKIMGRYCPHLNIKPEVTTILKLLFLRKANPNQVGIWNGFKAAPLDLATYDAVQSSDTSLVSLFLEAGANPKLDTNPENKEEVARCSYDIATHFKSAPNECPCGKESCEAGYQAKRATASKLLELFDAHIAQQASK